MSEPDPNLLHAFSVARADRPRSGKGKAATLAALGLSTPRPATDAARRERSPAANGSLRLPSWSLWSIGLALVIASAASFRAVHRDEPADPSAANDRSTAPRVHAEGPVSPPAVQVLAVDQLPDVSNPAPAGAATPITETKPSDVKVAATKSAEAKPARGAIPAARPEAAAAEPKADTTDSLRDEILAIERASRALSQRRCALAKTHLAAYGARYPNGRLRREAEVVSIEIAGRSGHDAEARSAARRFVTQFPESPYALRLAPWLRDGAGGGAGSVDMCTDSAD